MTNFFLGPFLIWSSAFFSFLILATAAFRYFLRIRGSAKTKELNSGHPEFSSFLREIFKFVNYKFLIVCLVSFKLFYAAVLTVLQYYAWSGNEFTKLLLPPHQSIKYFLLYCWTHFWFNAVISVALAVVFYLFLKSLKKYKERFFEEGEAELGFLCALIVGWPNFIVWLPLVFVLFVLISFFRRIFLKEAYTTISLSLLVATAIALIFGNRLIAILNLGVLRI